jgi:signal transduction histidine kinase
MSNNKLLDMAKSVGNNDVLAMRPGEILNCKYSGEEPGGCGTSEHCRYCGAMRAILCAQQYNRKSTEECRMTIRVKNHEISADFKVTVAPFKWQNRDYEIITLNDISHEKRRRAMERIFFHDLVNKTGSLKGFLGLLKSDSFQHNSEELMAIAETITEDLVEELISYRMLLEAENNELRISKTRVNAADILRSVKSQLELHEIARDKVIKLSAGKDPIVISTEPVLLKRILTNMLKNALEASDAGDIVRIGCSRRTNAISFWVHNAAVMSPEVQLQVFQRSFSTKGVNRGLGTYSMKILGESYLNGKVTFKSVAGEGTLFSIMLPLGQTNGED